MPAPALCTVIFLLCFRIRFCLVQPSPPSLPPPSPLPRAYAPALMMDNLHLDIFLCRYHTMNFNYAFNTSPHTALAGAGSSPKPPRLGLHTIFHYIHLHNLTPRTPSHPEGHRRDLGLHLRPGRSQATGAASLGTHKPCFPRTRADRPVRPATFIAFSATNRILS